MITKQKLAEKIKKFREDHGLSQEVLAAKLGLPRPSVSQIESGQRDINSIELMKLARIFGISVDDLLSEDLEKKGREISAEESRMPEFNKKKFKQVLLYILDRCGAKANVGETILYKLLYFIDFNFYELYEEPLTGEAYVKISYGPAPCHFQEVMAEMIKDGEIKKVTTEYYGKPQKKYLPLVGTDIDKWNWSAREKETIDRVIEELAGKDATTISNYSHNDIPWKAAKDKALINYETVFYRTAPYSVRSYPEE